MDYRKINSHIILSLIVLFVGITISMIGRRVMLEKGFDAGTANLIFIIILGICVIGYLVILATLAHTIVPWVMKKLPKKNKPTPIVIQDNNNVFNEKEEILEQSIEDIRLNADKLYIEKQTARINLFLEYSHLTMAPYITDDELLRLDEYIQCYAREESLPNSPMPIKPDKKLKNPDIFHFGWNMAHYFDFPKQDVAPWLQQVFANLHELEYSYIKGKLHDSQTKKYIIPNIDDIPKYLAEQNG